MRESSPQVAKIEGLARKLFATNTGPAADKPPVMEGNEYGLAPDGPRCLLGLGCGFSLSRYLHKDQWNFTISLSRCLAYTGVNL